MFLTGEYHHQIDEKNRIRIPAKLKELLGENPLIMLGNGKCLYVYSQERAQQVIAEKLDTLDLANDKKAMLARRLMPFTLIAEEDKQGRVTLTDTLIKKGGLGKNIVTIGAYDRAEIWSEEAWEEFSQFTPEEYDECLKALSKDNESL